MFRINKVKPIFFLLRGKDLYFLKIKIMFQFQYSMPIINVLNLLNHLDFLTIHFLLNKTNLFIRRDHRKYIICEKSGQGQNDVHMQVPNELANNRGLEAQQLHC